MSNYILSRKESQNINKAVPAVENKSNKVRLVPKAIAKWLISLIGLLLVANLFSLFVKYNLPEGARLPLLLDKYFNFNNEANFPTLFASVILLIASGLLFYISRISEEKKDKKLWLILSYIFLFLCFDEATQIHDELVLTVRNRLPENLPGIFYYAWVIPYSIFFLGVVVYFIKFVLSLPPKTRNLFFLAGFVYVFGAVGFELIEGYFEKLYGKANIYYELLTTLEELLEKVGIVILIYALLDYIAPYKTEVIVKPKA